MTSPVSLIARIERHPEHRNLPDFIARNFLLQTGHDITNGNTDELFPMPPLEKNDKASSAVFLMLKN